MSLQRPDKDKEYFLAQRILSCTWYLSCAGRYCAAPDTTKQHKTNKHSLSIYVLAGYHGSSAAGSAGSSLPLQQQLEHANQKSGFGEDKFKMQQVGERYDNHPILL